MIIYLQPLIKKVTNNIEIINKCSTLNSDKEIMDFLSNKIDIQLLRKAFERHYGLKYIDFKEINNELLDNFDIEFLIEQKTIPYSFNNETWTFAISDLTDRNLQSKIKNEVMMKTNKSTKFVFAFEYEIESMLNKNNSIEIKAPTSNAIEWIEAVINLGIELKASDIHIESIENGVQVRYRVDGTILEKQTFNVNESEASNLFVRLKLIGNMDISEKRRSQDGRIDNYIYNNGKYSLRISTINTIHGEKFALRILSNNEENVDFSTLGFTENQERKIANMLKKPNGIIYLAGATGSGKTTTLYAMINKFDEDLLNIYTIENPVEKSVEGINQIQIDEAHGNTYPSVLKTLLRQDPDVLVVGEIRESETAKLAVQSSLTGHFVLTTIHANNALESVTRLLDMGVESYLVGASSVGFISQRLMRKLCDNCKEKIENIPHHEYLWIKEEMNNFNYNEFKNKGEYFYQSKGCSKCVNGYKGRIAVLEIIEVDDKLREMISKQTDSSELKKYLNEINYKTMKYDGIQKALKGITSIQELIGKLQS